MAICGRHCEFICTDLPTLECFLPQKFPTIQYSLTVSPRMQILDAMNQDSELPLSSVRVDGGMTGNKLMLQLQADVLGIKMGTATFV